MYKPHTFCRACGFGKPEIPTLKQSASAGDAYSKPQSLVAVLDLGIQPLANDFAEPLAEREGYAPLKLLYCPLCSLAQLSVVVNPGILYGTYNYVTSHSQTMLDHFRKIREDIVAEATAARSVMEIGSNDGSLLGFLKNNPFENVLGYEPANNLASTAVKNGIKTRNVFFNSSEAQVRGYSTSDDVIIARHVMCHIDDWRDFIKALGMRAHKETLICIEVPSVMDMITNVSFDQIYHEHLSYLPVKAMKALLEGSGLHVHNVVRYPIHGGSIMIMLRRDESVVPPKDTAYDYENVSLADWQSMAEHSELLAMELGNLVRDLVSKGKTVVGYGASAKSTVWINTCRLTRKEIKFICDETPNKQWKCSPGSDIPIVDPGALTRELPDYAICFAWNFQAEIMAKEEIFKAKGGRWIIPVPKARIV